jgi:hypothetical protein
MDVETVFVIEGEDDPLAATGKVDHESAGKMGGQVETGRGEYVGPECGNVENLAAQEPGTQGIDNCLHFREFGHETFLIGRDLLWYQALRISIVV